MNSYINKIESIEYTLNTRSGYFLLLICMKFSVSDNNNILFTNFKMFPNHSHAFSNFNTQNISQSFDSGCFLNWNGSGPQFCNPFFYYYNVVPLQQNNLFSLNQNFITQNHQKLFEISNQTKQLQQNSWKKEKIQKNRSKQNQIGQQLIKYPPKRQQTIKIKSTSVSSFKLVTQNSLIQSQIKKRRCWKPQAHCELQDEGNKQLQNKRKIQNLRYKKKNIEANIVNRIFSNLVNCFKTKICQQQIDCNNKQKYNLFLKVLKKVQQGWKLPIKRSLLKMLVEDDDNLPRYQQICKILAKHNLTVQQFQIQVRTLIRNYLKKDIILSILTSRKMKAQNWKEHLQKVRQIYRFIFNLQKTELQFSYQEENFQIENN